MVQPTLASVQGQRRNSTHSVSEAQKTIVDTLAVLAEPGQVVELRIPGLNGRRTDSGYFTDWTKLAQAAASYNNRAEGIYVTVNPLQPALLARSSNRMTEYAKQSTSDKDILRRRWLFVDFDPVRPSGISSSDAEHEAAIARATQCRDWLAEQSISSVLANSGNGAHLLVPVDLPNDDGSTALLKMVLQVLSARFSDEVVEIDTSTVNAARIIKLYGTTACKGDNVLDRPHRRAALLDVPETLRPIDRTHLDQLIAGDLDEASTDQEETATRPTNRVRAGLKPSSERYSGSGRVEIVNIKAQFDMVAYAEQTLGVSAMADGHEYRLPGQKGFLINPEKGCWYHHGGQFGGDALDLVGYLRFGSSWDRQDATNFKTVLSEAAQFAGVEWQETTTRKRKDPPNGKKTNKSKQADDTESSEPKPAKPPKVDLMNLAQAWKQRYANTLAWDANVPAWRRWTGTHWQIIREPDTLDLFAVEIIHAMGLPVSNIGTVDSVIRLARALCKRQFLPSTRLINFQNGTLDLDTMTGHPHTVADNLISCLPYDYSKKGDYPTIADFLRDTIPDEEARRAYMTHLGLALCNDQTLHKALVLIGPPRSGKSTLLKLAQSLMGVSAGNFPTAILFSSESRGANSRATWIDHSPRLVCLDEFPEEAVRDDGEELFKSMTAHGGVSMWLKYKDERSENAWTPKLMFATNNRMRYRDSSGALTRRLLIVECPNSLTDVQLDLKLDTKFTPELGAFATACIALALEVLDTQKYPESAAMRALLMDIERNGDAVKLWVAENCIFEPNAFTTTHMLYENFRGWCEENGLHAVSRPKLRDMLYGYRAGVHSAKRRTAEADTGSTKPLWGMVGIRLRTLADDMREG